ncbi:alpha-glucosidase C-terminal domain-containing protein [Streptomyces sp. MP131-18]|uniref:alpha-glucosidase C-terminal domain-containing protein n=1 Tax=Streptomyces sp. MP131-18 TaxID=1857892 RepID=UPI00097C4813|nr:alpha-glucosidase C-terminal domain-containing protein [Streptomyces sp. MP131-18]ONK10444.1 hypothetical protein STBA_11660 [Streptomyces sp. MP131-18]
MSTAGPAREATPETGPGDSGAFGDFGDYLARLARERPDLVTLAESLSLAATVDRPLLRRARLRFVPRSTAGLEAELWFSPLVEAVGDRALLFSPEAAAALRARLAERPAAHRLAVRTLIDEAHARAPGIVRVCEDLLWADVAPAAVAETHLSRQVGRLLAAVADEGESGDDMGRWALYYLNRLPPGVRSRRDVWQVQVASAERLGTEPPENPHGHPPAVASAARALVHREVALGVRLLSDGLVLSRPPRPGDRVVRVTGGPRTRLDVRHLLSHVDEPRRIELREGDTAHLPFTVVQIFDREGNAVLHVAHPGATGEVAVAREPGGRARVAVLLPDGAIALHDDSGAETDRIPPGSGRRQPALSDEGQILTWRENGRPVVWDLPTMRELGGRAMLSDALLLRPVSGAGDPELWRLLPFHVTHHADAGRGTWVAAGTGGPVEIRAEDGSAFLLAPEAFTPEETPGLPPWSRGCVLAEVPWGAADVAGLPARLPALATAGLDGIVLTDAWPGADGALLELLPHARAMGLRLLVDVVGGSAHPADLLDHVRRLLDRGADGVRLSGGGGRLPPPADLGHLLAAYQDRALMVRLPTWPRSARRQTAATVSGAEEYVASVILHLAPDSQLSLPLPQPPDAGVTGRAAKRAAAFALSLPGSPALPLPLATAGALWPLLRQRRNQLALSRGDCEVIRADDSVLGLLRRHGDERVLCLVNMSGSEAGFAFGDEPPAGRPVDLLGEGRDLPRDRLPERVAVPGHGVRWFRLLAPAPDD